MKAIDFDLLEHFFVVFVEASSHVPSNRIFYADNVSVSTLIALIITKTASERYIISQEYPPR